MARVEQLRERHMEIALKEIKQHLDDATNEKMRLIQEGKRTDALDAFLLDRINMITHCALEGRTWPDYKRFGDE